MKGQWLGEFKGTNNGKAVINIDEKIDTFGGVAHFFDNDRSMPMLAVHFEIEKSNMLSGVGACKSNLINPLQPDSFTEVNWDAVKHLYPDITFPKTIDISFEHEGNQLKVRAKTDIDTEVEGILLISSLETPSELQATEMSWEQFKLFVVTNQKELIYRGQNEPWKLQTSFHRRGRYDLTRYQVEDIPQLHRALSSKTQHVFNLSNPQEHGAFLNLAQHHGYPTPLLDWSNSPYVAAFFAFRGISKYQAEQNPNKKVRIYIFDSIQWRKIWIQNQNMLTGQMHLSVIDLLAIENNRMVPQQATTTVTNVADIESLIIESEKRSNKKFLQVIDIPWKERESVVRELTLMGLTAGSLFPGLDGTCEELKDKMFE
ncbi:FRG domain-containing protein [Vibrio parahaemolyticus]|uniref:FRG domain-containing protein n=1 Tax=Vibrio parahaemolyticus TaxID=670 RepID=UPI00111EAE5B|nr:FRG domain-containing protein [Vibrio parahaemolyticus]EGQ7810954.1 FRG domain-containing protein [Vibrio parahaemolyticus]EHD0108234.1 FRG domain-containing protein [Vibrio parahaemolyticus]EIV8651437.1 FRG domain-containing protein [Vibrio parahaemolyticus]EJG1118522.1 FRG domain-containing protein [Vibrio parahaemolyticus]MBM4981181.1 FRG domain-containing protein [Vibrio parahaemolyticus]